MSASTTACQGSLALKLVWQPFRSPPGPCLCYAAANASQTPTTLQASAFHHLLEQLGRMFVRPSISMRYNAGAFQRRQQSTFMYIPGATDGELQAGHCVGPRSERGMLARRRLGARVGSLHMMSNISRQLPVQLIGVSGDRWPWPSQPNQPSGSVVD